MRTWTETHREGTDMGPIDWTTADVTTRAHAFGGEAGEKLVALLKLAEERLARGEPSDVLVTTDGGWPRCGWHEVYAVRLYDGWPYWEPRPAVLRAGTIGGSEWDFFSSIIEVRDRRAEGRS
jgi:hypothetical protein